MTFTASLPTTRDHVRLRIGDVETGREIWADAVYDAVITALEVSTTPATAGAIGIRKVALAMAKNGMGRFARDVDESPVGISNQRSQKFQHFKDLVRELQDETNKGPMEVYFGGLSKAEALTLSEDSDFVGNNFAIGMHDNVPTSPEGQ